MAGSIKAISVSQLATKPIWDLVKAAQTAERSGVDEFWLGENYHWFRRYGSESRGAVTAGTAIALNTSKIQIGFGIVSVYTRHPSILAMEALSISEISKGRFALGLGAAKMGVVHMGFKTKDALVVHSEALRLIRALLAGGPVDFKGEVFRLVCPASSDPTRTRYKIPIILGATGDKLLQLSGELADGVMTPTLSSPNFIRHAVKQVQTGAKRGSRQITPENFRVSATLISSVDKDSGKAKDAVRKILATYFTNKLVNIKNDMILEAAGIDPEEIRPIADLVLADKYDKATKMVTDEMIDRAAVAGNVDEVCGRLEKYAKAGLQMPSMVLFGDVKESIRLLGKEVRPRIVRK